MPAITRHRASLKYLALAAVLGLLQSTAPGLATEALPSAVDLRPHFKEWGLTVNNQGSRGTCVLQAITGVLEYEHAARGAPRGPRLSVDYLVWAARDVTGRKSEDSWFPGALAAVNRHGVCSDELMPYAARFNPANRPSAKGLADGRTRTGVVADWVRPLDPKPGMTPAQLLRAKQALVAGHPIAAAFKWPKKLELTADHTFKVPNRDGVGGTHAIVLVGYADGKEPGGGVFLVRNSWGPKWGDGGYARMPYAYAAAHGLDAVSLRVGQNVKTVTNRPKTAVGLYKAEDTPIAQTTGGVETSKQDMSGWGKGLWNRNSQLACNGKPGGALVLRLKVAQAGDYRVDFYGTRAPDHARLRLTLDGQPLGGALNTYAPGVAPTGCISLGVRRLKAGDHLLRFVVVDKVRESLGHRFGIDGIDLVPVTR
jgi:hypothetical protein